MASEVLKHVSFSSHPSNFWPILTSAPCLQWRETYSPSAETWRKTNLEIPGKATDHFLLGLKSFLCLHWRKVSSPAKGTWEPLWAPHHPKSELRAASREGPRPTTRGLGLPPLLGTRSSTDATLSPPRTLGGVAWLKEINF